MPDRLTFEETVKGGATVGAQVELASEDTRVRVIAESLDDRDELVLAKINQLDTTLVDQRGLPLVREGIDELADRVSLDAEGLQGTPEIETEAPTESAVEPADAPAGDAAGSSAGVSATTGDEEEEPAQTPDHDREPTERVRAVLEEQGELAGPAIKENADVSQSEFYEAVGELENEIGKRRDPEDGRRKLYRLDEEESESESFYCGLCGYEAGSKNGIIVHHGREHGAPDPQVLDEPPEEPVEENGFWCGRCGDGPFQDAVDVDEHHGQAHGKGNAIALEDEPDQEDLEGEVDGKPQGFRDWDGSTEQRQETTPATDGGRP